MYFNKSALRRKQHGLTLVELMVVIAIVAILASLASERFERFRGRAVLMEASLNLKQLHTLAELYFVENLRYEPCPSIGYGVDNGSSNPATKCNVENAYGFEINNCTKVNFRYWVDGYRAGVWGEDFVEEFVHAKLIAFAGGDKIPSCNSNIRIKIERELPSGVQKLDILAGVFIPQAKINHIAEVLRHCNR